METLKDSELCFPQLLNASCIRTKRPHHEALLTYVLVVSISLLTTFLNLLVIVSISHFKQLHTSTNLLLLSLAVSDFFVGLLLSFQLVLIGGCWFLGDLMCSLYQYLDYVISSVSVGNMVLISIDRYLAVCHPLLYATKVTPHRVHMCVCLCWICSVIFQTLVLMDVLSQPGRFNSCAGECVFVINHIAGVADVIFSFVAPITVIIVLYIKVFVVAVTQARALRSHMAAVSVQHSVRVTALRSELKAARTLGVVIAVFLMCLCPYYCVALTGQDNLINTSSAALCLYSFNSCLNPVIYAFFYPWFRKSIKDILTLTILQPNSCERNMSWKNTKHESGDKK
ncbi:trace amine-associated receptor 13c-like [Betta splendens]|uniref:Trace amine-associated receptor 13c-like n=1 Tax=Betta splendens TaxID=158456 RepID=A0A6P7LD07_BETSP|nr:trace amine-associated receptor 13c-like [Betta splendens]